MLERIRKNKGCRALLLISLIIIISGLFCCVYAADELHVFDYEKDYLSGDYTPTGLISFPTYETEGRISAIDNRSGETVELALRRVDSKMYDIVPYIEGGYGGYINTGVLTNKSDRLITQMDIQFLDTRLLWTGANPYTQLWYDYVGTLDRVDVRIEYNLREWGFQYVFVNGNCTRTIDWEAHAYLDDYKDVRIGIFVLGDSNNSWFPYSGTSARLFSETIIKNDVLERAFIPVVNNVIKEAGLYDAVTGRFFENFGPGCFKTVYDCAALDDFEILPSLHFDGETYVDLWNDVEGRAVYDFDCIDCEFTQVADKPNLVSIGKNSRNDMPSVLEFKNIKAYAGEQLIGDYIPVMRKCDGAKGLYEKVHGYFFMQQRDIDDISNLLSFSNETYVPQFADIAVGSASSYDKKGNLINKYGFKPVDVYDTVQLEKIQKILKLIPGVLLSDLDQEALLKMGIDANMLLHLGGNFSPEPEHGDGYYLLKKPYMKDGELHYLYLLDVCGSCTDTEWVSNFKFTADEDGYHHGFSEGAKFVLDSVKSQFTEDKDHRSLLITGYSRGAAIAAILAEKPDIYELFDYDDVRVYVGACPNYTVNKKQVNNLFILDNPGDMIPKLPFESWRYTKNGTVIDLDEKYMPEGYDGASDLSNIQETLLSIFNNRDLFNDDESILSVVKLVQMALGVYVPTAGDLLNYITSLRSKLRGTEYRKLFVAFIDEGIQTMNSHEFRSYKEWINKMNADMLDTVDARKITDSVDVFVNGRTYAGSGSRGMVCLYDSDGRFAGAGLLEDYSDGASQGLKTKFLNSKDAASVKIFFVNGGFIPKDCCLSSEIKIS